MEDFSKHSTRRNHTGFFVHKPYYDRFDYVLSQWIAVTVLFTLWGMTLLAYYAACYLLSDESAASEGELAPLLPPSLSDDNRSSREKAEEWKPRLQKAAAALRSALMVCDNPILTLRSEHKRDSDAPGGNRLPEYPSTVLLSRTCSLDARISDPRPWLLRDLPHNGFHQRDGYDVFYLLGVDGSVAIDGARGDTSGQRYNGQNHRLVVQLSADSGDFYCGISQQQTQLAHQFQAQEAGPGQTSALFGTKRCPRPEYSKRPSIGPEGGKALFCATHKVPDHVNVKSPHCHHPGCSKRPSFGPEGGKALFCVTHKERDHVDVKSTHWGTHMVILEVDEDQHRDEETLFVRFNPDAYRAVYLCYDGFDANNVEIAKLDYGL
ncbi:hypothetical protein DFS34DRAFT_651099 [Phlyctochytrium arcticum]|nr:hypothetical protein DFS34DRAFT_651099 [Phlyctochytrium arcticum]